jgi:hypothetical protein
VTKGNFGAVVIAAALASSCGGSGPADVAERFGRLVEQGEVQEASQLVSGEIVGILGQEKLEAVLAGGTREIAERDGIESFEVLSEDVSGSIASLTVRTTYGDGSATEETMELTRLDGEWKLSNPSVDGSKPGLTLNGK